MRNVRLLVALAAMFAVVFSSACSGDSGETNCSDNTDNDLDGLTDCADPDCYGSAACTGEICNNYIDDDGDGLIDCADPSCTSSPLCTATCGNNVCDAGETQTCPQDCQANHYCGDGNCDSDETASSCPADCGTVCNNNGTCDAGETALNCPADCSSGACDSIAALVNQTGCNAGEACTVIDANGTIGCMTAGTVAPYAECSTTIGDCLAGALCAGDPATQLYTCMPYCDLNGGSTCPSGGLCLYSFATAQGNVGLCSPPDDCDLVDATGCTTGQGCYIADQSGATVCTTAGTVALGGSCTYTNDCGIGVGCMGNPGVCTELCHGDGDCTTGTCQGIGQVAPGANNADVGACQ